ncbi:MAG: hypothetical protein C9356_15790 [Oleiphilus sp.]|nr:MAG: hypothetical protein C9356_15790 [Oleiphilus sp.]
MKQNSFEFSSELSANAIDPYYLHEALFADCLKAVILKACQEHPKLQLPATALHYWGLENLSLEQPLLPPDVAFKRSAEYLYARETVTATPSFSEQDIHDGNVHVVPYRPMAISSAFTSTVEQVFSALHPNAYEIFEMKLPEDHWIHGYLQRSSLSIQVGNQYGTLGQCPSALASVQLLFCDEYSIHYAPGNITLNQVHYPCIAQLEGIQTAVIPLNQPYYANFARYLCHILGVFDESAILECEQFFNKQFNGRNKLKCIVSN